MLVIWEICRLLLTLEAYGVPGVPGNDRSAQRADDKMFYRGSNEKALLGNQMCRQAHDQISIDATNNGP